jgi:hypothetical protein
MFISNINVSSMSLPEYSVTMGTTMKKNTLDGISSRYLRRLWPILDV